MQTLLLDAAGRRRSPPTRQLGHTNLGITSIYLQGIDSTEIIDTVHSRRPPMIPDRRPHVDMTTRHGRQFCSLNRNVPVAAMPGKPGRALDEYGEALA